MQEQVTKFLQEINIPYWSWNLFIIGASLLFGLVISLILSLVVKKKAKNSQSSSEYSFFQSLLRRLGLPLNVFLPLFLFNALLPVMRMPPAVMNNSGKAIEILLIISFAWILIRCIKVAQDYVLYRYDIK